MPPMEYQCAVPNFGRVGKLVMQDPDAPAAARVGAARTALELAGDLGGSNSDGSEGRHLCELTPGELSDLIDKWEDDRIQVAKDITPAGTLFSVAD